MILLAIDTATESCSAALSVDGKLYQRSTIQPRLHAELILPFIDELLIEAQITKSDIKGLVVGQGPGAFTGVRIGVAVAQGLALALNIPVVAVSNLETLAFYAYLQLNTDKPKNILVATDARMQEVYSCKYLIEKNHIQPLSAEVVGKSSNVNTREIDAYIGSGFSIYPELKKHAIDFPMPYETTVYSHAKDMLLMANDKFEELAKNVEVIEPVYLREP